MKKIYLFGALASTLVVIPSTATVFAQEGHNITPAILRDLEEVGAETEVAEGTLVEVQSEGPEVPEGEANSDLGSGASGEANDSSGADSGSDSGDDLDDPSSETAADTDSDGDSVVPSAGATEDDLKSGSDEDKEGNSETSGDSLTSLTVDTSGAASASVTFAAESDSKQVDDGIAVLDGEQQVQKNSTLFKTGKGTVEDPYQISTAEELDAVRYDLGAHYIQTANIDLKGINWNPIGMETEEEAGQAFTGVFDGANFEITNLTIQEIETTQEIFAHFYGLFAKNEGVLKNIKLLNIDIEVDTGNINKTIFKSRRPAFPHEVGVLVGGITGWNEGTISGCTTSGKFTIHDGGWAVFGGGIAGLGGFTGNDENHVIVDCINYADFNVDADTHGTSTIGGIAGYVYGLGVPKKVTLKNCINSGNIYLLNIGNCSVGGIAGVLSDTGNNLINYGSIQIENKSSAYCSVGGIAGKTTLISSGGQDNNSAERGRIISNVLNFGNITFYSETLSNSKSVWIGGLFGEADDISKDGLIKDVYNLGGKIDVNVVDLGETTLSPIYRITSTKSSYTGKRTSLVLENCYAASDFLINGEKVTDLIGLDQDNGESLSREELVQLVKKVFPNVVIVNPGETLDAPLPTVTNATFSKDGISIEAESDQNLSGLSMVISEVSDAKNNFGLPSNYQTIGYDIHFADKNNSEVKRTGKFIVRLPIPTDFIGKTVRIFHKEDEQDEGSELKYSIIDGKFYEFETSSFSWFIVAYDKNTQAALTPSGDNQKPTQNEQKPVQNEQKPTSIEEDKNLQTVSAVNTSETAKAETVKLEQINVAVLEQVTTDSTVKRSPETGVGTHSFGSVFAGLISLLGLSVLGKKRTKNEF